MKYEFDYSKLKGRIVEKCDTQNNFSIKLGMSPQVLNKRLQNEVQFNSSEILRIAEILEIPKEDITDYFFTEKVEKSQEN